MTRTTKHIPFFDYLRQYAAMRDEIDRSIRRVVESGRLILDREVAAFESEFAAYCGCAHGIAVNSGTDALEIALRAAGIGNGDEVMTVPNTSVATVSAIRSAGAAPVFVDISADSMLIDPAGIPDRISTRTKAIIPVHLFGQAAEMEPIMRIARERKLVVIEDCAQSHGAMIGDRMAGSVGHASCFSFYPTKNLGAFGDAGMVLTNDGEIAALAREIRTYGWRERDLSERHGVNSRMDELQAAVLRTKLPRLEEWNGRRTELAALYTEGLTGLPLAVPPPPSGRRHVFHLYVVRTPRRDELRKFLESRGVTTLVHYPLPIHLQPAYADPRFGRGSFPESERAQREVLSLPIFPEMTDDEAETVCSHIREFFSGGR